MTKQKILNYFKDINEAYNDSTRLDSLSRMLDELLESKRGKIKQLKAENEEIYMRWLYAGRY